MRCIAFWACVSLLRRHPVATSRPRVERSAPLIMPSMVFLLLRQRSTRGQDVEGRAIRRTRVVKGLASTAVKKGTLPRTAQRSVGRVSDRSARLFRARLFLLHSLCVCAHRRTQRQCMGLARTLVGASLNRWHVLCVMLLPIVASDVVLLCQEGTVPRGCMFSSFIKCVDGERLRIDCGNGVVVALPAIAGLSSSRCEPAD